MKRFLLIAVSLWGLTALPTSTAQERWQITAPQTITWQPKGEAHADHIEMSGKRVSVIYRYGVDARGRFHVNKGMVWPLLRTVPNDTHASLMRRFDWDPLQSVTVNGLNLDGETVEAVRIDGTLSAESTFDWGWDRRARLYRRYFPSTEQPAAIETYTLVNEGKHTLRIEVPQTDLTWHTDARLGVDGSYRLEATMSRPGTYYLHTGDTLTLSAYIAGYKPNEPSLALDAAEEYGRRSGLVRQLAERLVLETPDPVINTLFAFTKLRASESIYETAGGPMHGPGGESFYAAIWANDQAEYVNPYFPFTGYEYGCRSALNSYLHFARFMNDRWDPIPSSIIAEGKDIWNGAGDRGDAAMIAYGASRYALARGDRKEAEQLWPLISWCLEYCHRKLTPEGVVASDSDELEGRFPSGKANLCTSSLYYDALLSAACLTEELGKGSSTARTYRKQAQALRKAIDAYFGANVEGFDTYAYYEGNDVLRAWICIPLTVGITERAAGTIEALFSPRLWTENGLLTQAGDKTFWDRSTLYALRGVYAAGETGKATDYLHRYSATRLLGNHVPYPIEAWPEGNQRHLSAESGLYGRIVTEGLFGIRPTGFHRFTLTPHLPADWNYMKLRDICAFGTRFDIRLERTSGQQLRLTVKKGERVVCQRNLREGQTVEIRL